MTIRGPKRRLAELKAEGRDEVPRSRLMSMAAWNHFPSAFGVRPPTGTWVAGIDPSEVSVQVNIIKASASRTWSGLKVLAIQEADAPSEVKIRPARVEITVEGRAEIVENLSEQDIRIFVDCIGLDRVCGLRVAGPGAPACFQ